MKWTEMPDQSGKKLTTYGDSYEALISRLRTVGTFPSKSACPWIKLATFGTKTTASGSLRTNDNLEAVYGVEGDYDGGVISMEDAIARLTTHGVRAALYPSPSSTPDAPRWRVLAPLSKAHQPIERERLVARLNGALGGVLAAESFVLSQSYYFGGIEGNAYRVLLTSDDAGEGTCVDELPALDAIAIGKRAATPATSATTPNSSGNFADKEAQLGRKLAEGDGRREMLKAFVASQSAKGRSASEIWLMVKGIEAEHFEGEIDEDNIRSMVAHIVQKDAQRSAASVLESFENLEEVDPQTGEITKRPGSRTFEFMSAGDMTRAPTPVAYLVDELIEQKALALLFAPPSAGKSFCAIGWACCVATGTPWLGRNTIQGAVFYLAGEGHQGLSRRLMAWTIHSGQSLADAPLFVSKVPAALMDKESVKSVLAAVEALTADHGQPALIVVDTLARNLGGGDESSNSDVGVFINHLDAMRSRLGCALLVVHHSGHGDNGRARGASALNAAMDASFKLEKNADGMRLTQTKSKEAEICEPLHLELLQVALPWLDERGRPMNSAVLIDKSPRVREVALTPQHQIAFDAFRRAAIALSSTDVPITHWRLEFDKTATQTETSARTGALKRARDVFLETGLMSAEGETYRLEGEKGRLLVADFFDDLTVPKH